MLVVLSHSYIENSALKTGKTEETKLNLKVVSFLLVDAGS